MNTRPDKAVVKKIKVLGTKSANWRKNNNRQEKISSSTTRNPFQALNHLKKLMIYDN